MDSSQIERKKKKKNRDQQAQEPQAEDVPEQADGKERLLKKRKRMESEESKGSGYEDIFKAGEKGEVIDVDFELVQPSEAYYHSVRALLNQFLDGEEGEQLDLSGLADQVVNTISIGSVVASALEQNPEDMPEYKDLPDEEFQKVALKYNSARDVYGFTTILSLTKRQKQHKCFQQIIKYAQDKAQKHCNDKQRDQFLEILKSKNVGLLINERLINLPYLLVPQLHQSLPDDLKFTKKQDDIKDPKEFDYGYLLVISRYAIENERKGKDQKKQKVEEKLYYKQEDEILSRSAEVSFSFKTIFRETQADGTKMNLTGGGGAPETHYKLVYLIKYSDYEKRIKELDKLQ